MSQRDSLRWASCAYSLDAAPASPQIVAAYLVSIRYLDSRIRPHWILSSNSDGRNFLGHGVPRAGFVASHIEWGNRKSSWDRQFRALLEGNVLPEGFARSLADRLQEELYSQLLRGAHIALMARASRLCRPDLSFHDLLLGPARTELVVALTELHSSPDGFRRLHEEITRTQLSSRVENERPVPLHERRATVSGRSAASPRASVTVETISFPRALCDTVYTIAFPVLAIGQFAALCHRVRVIADEFRRRRWACGGIYAAGAKVSFVERSVSWWTNLDERPLETYSLIRSLLQAPELLSRQADDASLALADLPSPPPAWAGRETSDCAERLWGVSSQDRAALIESRPQRLDASVWSAALRRSVFCVCGPERILARVLEAQARGELEPDTGGQRSVR